MWTELLSPIVVTSADDDQRTALSILLCNLDSEEKEFQLQKMQASVDQGELSLDGLLLARLDQAAVGALLLTIQSDATAYVWPPVIPPNSTQVTEAASSALLKAAVEHIEARNCWIGHSILAPNDPKLDVMERAGVERLVELRVMDCVVAQKLTEPDGQKLCRIPYDTATDSRFKATLQQTYIDTRDCPEIVGLRTSTEALEGHRLAGSSIDAFWYLYQVDGEDAAILLIAEDSKLAEREISYLGVTPKFRRQGLARRITAEALFDAATAGMQSVTLSVDERNEPAITLYESLGFVLRSRQIVHAVKIRR